MLVGCGPHAKRIYVPLFRKYKNRINICCVVDIKEKEEETTNFLQSLNCKTHFIEKKHLTSDKLHPSVEKKLNEFVKQYNIQGVVISTEPLTHVMYSKWALKNNLSILLDKPVSTYPNVSTKANLAKKILIDYDDLAKIYRKKPNVSFSLMSQRRFHPAFRRIRHLIHECYKQTNCPVTSIQSFHCDGQWRMPTEIVDQMYHPYCQGYGKGSHSGYHFFDIVPFLIGPGYAKNKAYDEVTAYSTVVRPLDFLQQINFKDYEKLFGKEQFNFHNKYSEKECGKIMKNFGEMDVFTNLELKRNNQTITLASINLAHNGFAQRDWITAKGRDLYKGNGRVRQETHIIQQGPFQAVHYHSYQSKEVDPKKKSKLCGVGGEYHSEIYIFRNEKVIGGKNFERVIVPNLNKIILKDKSRGHQEDARAKGFLEFIEFLEGKRKREEMTSDFLTHRMGSLITSLVYQSIVSQYNNKNAKVGMKVK
jgi:predicted dehydrogenase